MAPKKQRKVKTDNIGHKNAKVEVKESSEKMESDKHAKVEAKETSAKKTANKAKDSIQRGQPKSGRFWKNTKTKFSSIIKTKGIKKPYEKKEAFRKELQRVKELSRSIKAQKEEEKQLHKERRRENLRRREENRKKSEVVQVITNTAKLKRMKKKNLRTVEKRDTSNL